MGIQSFLALHICAAILGSSALFACVENVRSSTMTTVQFARSPVTHKPAPVSGL